MRDTTERPEAVDAGTVKLVGTNPELVEKLVIELLENNDVYQKMAEAHNPYGDGCASKNIIKFLEDCK